MNLRVQLLEKQASDYYWSLDDDVRKADAFTQKLAELIVAETLNKINDSMELTWPEMEVKIKEHFGVEV
jgi:hypothetical protein